VPQPAPKDDQVLIKVRATSVTAGDWRVRSGNVPRDFGFIMRLVLGITKPRQPILGTELAGEIEAVGKAVTRFKVGDQVFAFSGRMGGHAEYKCMPGDGPVALEPANLTYEEAAALSFGGTTALHFFRRGKLQKGDRVLILRRGWDRCSTARQALWSGGDGCVCSTANLDLVKSIGADKVIDYTKEDFTLTGETYDVIVDTAGTAPFSRSKRALKQEGRLLPVLAGLPEMLKATWVSMTSGKKVVVGPATGRAEDLRFLATVAESGEFRPVIDRRYAFEQIAEAHRYVDQGHKKGNVVITVAP
jgi:NADPH:quinone reductase-like Zn-dependent oxidoreductase